MKKLLSLLVILSTLLLTSCDNKFNQLNNDYYQHSGFSGGASGGGGAGGRF